MMKTMTDAALLAPINWILFSSLFFLFDDDVFKTHWIFFGSLFLLLSFSKFTEIFFALGQSLGQFFFWL